MRTKFLNSKRIKLLKKYLQEEPSVVLAFLFGSFAKGTEGEESDLDLALYLTDKKKEDDIRFKIAEIVMKEVDLIILEESSVPATLISNIFKTGILLVNKDEKLYWDLYLKNSLEAEDFLEFAQSFLKIYQKAKSLIPEEKVRLIERFQFLETELEEIGEFKKMTYEEYLKDKTKRRNIEKWTENIVNALIDISKIVLASKKRRMPRDYREALFNFGILAGLNERETKKLSEFAALRNILAHEYLDLFYNKIKAFIKDFSPLADKISDFLEGYLEK